MCLQTSLNFEPAPRALIGVLLYRLVYDPGNADVLRLAPRAFLGIRWILLAALVLSGCASAVKPPAPPPPAVVFDPDKTRVSGDALDDVMQGWMKSRHIPGLALAVVVDGHLAEARGYGLADVGSGARVRPDTAFPIASLSKPFLAIGVMMLVEEGKLRLDDPVCRYLDRTPRAWQKITVRNLLSHTSGIANLYNDDIIVNDFNLFGWRMFNHYFDTSGDVTAQSVLDALAEQPMKFSPGTRFSYSNSNYHLLAMIVQKVTGEPYEALLRKRMFEPLGMTRTRVYGDGPPLPDVASGYQWADDRLMRSTPQPTVDGKGSASGGIVTTVLDLAKWDAALGAGKLVSPATFHEMWTAQRLSDGTESPYGLGFFVRPIYEHPAIMHGGNWTGYSSLYMRFVNERMSLIVLWNKETDDFASLMETLHAHWSGDITKRHSTRDHLPD